MVSYGLLLAWTAPSSVHKVQHTRPQGCPITCARGKTFSITSRSPRTCIGHASFNRFVFPKNREKCPNERIRHASFNRFVSPRNREITPTNAYVYDDASLDTTITSSVSLTVLAKPFPDPAGTMPRDSLDSCRAQSGRAYMP